MDIKRTTTVNPTISTEVSKTSEDTSRSASEINKGVGGTKDGFETAKPVPAEFIASPSVAQKRPAISEQLAKNAANEIIQAARRENPAISAKEIASGLTAAATTAAVVPTTGPIIAAVLMQIAAIIVIIGEINSKALEDQAAAKEKEAGRWKSADKERITDSDDNKIHRPD